MLYTYRHAVAYSVIVTANAMLVSLEGLLATHQVPIPSQWAWIAPPLAAGISALTMALPRMLPSTPPAISTDQPTAH